MEFQEQISFLYVRPNCREKLLDALAEEIAENWQERFPEEEGFRVAVKGHPLYRSPSITKWGTGRKCSLYQGLLWGYEAQLSPTEESYQDIQVKLYRMSRSHQAALVIGVLLGLLAAAATGYYCYLHFPIQIQPDWVLSKKQSMMLTNSIGIAVGLVVIGLLRLILWGITCWSPGYQKLEDDFARVVKATRLGLAMQSQIVEQMKWERHGFSDQSSG